MKIFGHRSEKVVPMERRQKLLLIAFYHVMSFSLSQIFLDICANVDFSVEMIIK